MPASEKSVTVAAVAGGCTLTTTSRTRLTEPGYDTFSDTVCAPGIVAAYSCAHVVPPSPLPISMMLVASDCSMNASGLNGSGNESCTHSPPPAKTEPAYAPLTGSYDGADTHCWDAFWLKA